MKSDSSSKQTFARHRDASFLTLSENVNKHSNSVQEYGRKKYATERLEPVIIKKKSPINRRVPLELTLIDTNEVENTLSDNLYVSCGASIDEIKSGVKILVASKKILPPDPVIQRIQERVSEILPRSVTVNGIYDNEFAIAVSCLRSQLSLKGIEQGGHIDAKLLEYLFPEASLKNVELGLIEIFEKNYNLGEFPKVVIEAKRLLNVHYPKLKLSLNSHWNSEFVQILKQFQQSFFIEPDGHINSVTIKLLKGAKLQLLVAKGEATLIPCDKESCNPQNFIRTIQAIINKHLGNRLEQNGKFDSETAKVLEIAQKAADIKERGVFSKESYDGLILMLSKVDIKKAFVEKVRKILLINEILEFLDDNTKSQALLSKYYYTFKNGLSAEEIIYEKLLELRINLDKSESIKKFQLEERLEATGALNKNTAVRIYAILSASWCKNLVKGRSYIWREEVNALNAIGLRGWNIDSGPNDNKINEWNDTIIFAWKDNNQQIQFLEYCATTDPGISLDKHNRSKQSSMIDEGQYPYTLGYFNGSYGAAVPLDTSRNLTEKPFFKRLGINLYLKLKTFILGSHPFCMHWITTTSNLEQIEKVDQFSSGAQVLKIKKHEFIKSVTSIIKKAKDRSFLYTLIDMSEG